MLATAKFYGIVTKDLDRSEMIFIFIFAVSSFSSVLLNILRFCAP